ncbi:MAG: hypothetical protein L3J67_00835 [Hyphomicrobiaceae bacterium]|nr:hypothetical protein [Hyphomicrobiaceae bacterium]
MAREKQVTVEKLLLLGAEALAELVEEACDNDKYLRQRVKMRLAALDGVGSLDKTIAKRIRHIARSQSFIDWQENPDFARDLDNLRKVITDDIAAADPALAAERMWQFVDLSEVVYERVDDSSGMVATVLQQAIEDLGALWAKVKDRDVKALADRVFIAAQQDAYGIRGEFVAAFCKALGKKGRKTLKRRIVKELENIPDQAKGEEHNISSSSYDFCRQLQQLADAENDVDAFIWAVEKAQRTDTEATEVARRLIDAGRAQEALEWLDKARVSRWHTSHDAIDLRIKALEALGRGDEAQAQRWQYFEESLNETHLQDYLQRLPDFEDFEAERKAIEVAGKYSDATTALGFLVRRPELEDANALVLARHEELDGDRTKTLGEAADHLSEKHQVAATLVYRCLVMSVLKRADTRYYKYAARDLGFCEGLAAQIEGEDIDSHATFFADVKKLHGLKYRFWEQMEGK